MERKKVMFGRLSLLLATVIWGSSYVVLKDTADTLPAMLIYAIRFLVAGAVLTVIFWKKSVLQNGISDTSLPAEQWDFVRWRHIMCRRWGCVTQHRGKAHF